MRCSYLAQLLSILSTLFLAQVVSAQTTIHVPGDQATIQGAINVANNGDTVLVAPGTYYENINFKGKAITVTSSGGTAVTAIDGGGNESVVTFTSGEGSSSVLNGFTLQHGAASPNNRYMGGGIYVSGGSPVITNNIVQYNTSCGGGFGIGLYFSSPLIQNNSIVNNNNRNASCSGGDGGGILVGGAGTAQIIGNVVANNAAFSGDGGGIELFAAGTPVIRNNVISGNTASGLFPSTTGGGINMLNDSNPLMIGNLIYGNSAGQGAGVYFGSSSAIVVNNTIADNSVASLGSAAYVVGGAAVQFFNNILVGQSGQNAVYCGSLQSWQPSPAFNNNDAFSPSGSGFDAGCPGASGQNGNISTDPLFVNSAADFHLQLTSPDIDAGTNSAPNLPQTDYDGKPRIIDGNNDCVGTVDMGAYELQRAANVSFSTNLLSFGNEVIGTTSNTLPVTLKNAGNTCFQFSNVQTTGDFSQGNNCAAAGVPGGSSCTYGVTFTPITTGPRSGGLNVSGSDGVTTSNLNVSLSGYGLTAQPSIALSPVSLSFGAQLVGTTSPAQIITVTSTGNTALTISGINVSGPFLRSNNCPSSLPPTATCTISISFRPTAGGMQSGSLNITDNASGSPHTANLSGTGIDFSIAASPASASVKHGQSVKFTVTVNPLDGSFSSAVALSCSGLPSGGSCSFSPSIVTPGENGATSVMTVFTAGKTPRGNYNILITGKSGSDSHSTTVLLSVN